MISFVKVEALPTLIYWRAEVIRSVFGTDPDKRLLVANRQYYRAHIADGSHYAIVARLDDVDCGCGAVCFSSELPSPDNPSGLCAYIMNIYVRKQYRNGGIGHAIVNKLIEECRNRSCGKIYLESTEEAKSFYKTIGFTEMPDMMILKNG